MRQNRSEEKRNSYRFTTSLSVNLRTAKGVLPVLRILDMSTTGIRIDVAIPPEEPEVELLFDAPASLKGLALLAQLVRETIVHGDPCCYQLRYKFIIRNRDEINSLREWMLGILTQDHRGQRPAPSIVRYRPDDETGDKIWSVRSPNDPKELQKCLELTGDFPLARPAAPADFLAVYEVFELVSALIFVRDDPEGQLPADTRIGKTMAQLRGNGGRPAEMVGPFFVERDQEITSLDQKIIRRLTVIRHLFPALIKQLKNEKEITHLLATPSQGLEGYFQMWLFEKLDTAADSGEKILEWIRRKITHPPVYWCLVRDAIDKL